MKKYKDTENRIRERNMDKKERKQRAGKKTSEEWMTTKYRKKIKKRNQKKEKRKEKWRQKKGKGKNGERKKGKEKNWERKKYAKKVKRKTQK